MVHLLLRLCQWVVVLWLVVSLPLALRRVYGGSWPRTLLTVTGLSALYLAGFVSIGFAFILFMAIVTF